MTDYKPTFRPSPARRPLVQRLTPLAWVFLAIGAAVVLLAVAGCVITLTDRPTEEPWEPTPTAAPVPTATSAPTEAPSPSPTVWYEGMVSPTPPLAEPTPAFPAWWSDQMVQDADGKWWPPQEVQDMAVRSYEDFLAERRSLAEANDLEGTIEALPRWFAGDSLQAYTTYYTTMVGAGQEPLGITVWEDTYLQVQEWSADGMECTLGMTTRNGVFYGWVQEEWVETLRHPGGLTLFRLWYDSTDGRWKDIRYIDHYPVEASTSGGG